MLDDLLNDVFWRMQRPYQHERSPHQNRKQNANRQHEAVKHWQDDRKTVPIEGRQHLPAALDIRQQVSMREHGAFGMACGAGRINNQRQV